MSVDKLVDSTQLDADLTSVANAIRTNGGTSAQLAFPAGFVSAVQAIHSGMDLNDWVQNGPPQDVELETATKILAGTFSYKTGLKTISGPNVTTIGQCAFDNCTGITSMSFPNLTTVTGDYVFRKLNSLTSVIFPKLTTASGTGLFYQTRYDSSQLATIVLPAISNLGIQAFRQCKLKAVDCGPNYKQIKRDTFYVTNTESGGNHIGVVILRSTTLVTAASRDAVRNLATIYIPQVLYDHLGDGSSSDYRAATNWSTDASYHNFYPIEGSIYENAYADGTPIPTT